MSDTSERFIQHRLPALAAFFEYAAKRGLVDTGSSSIDPSFAPAFEHIKKVMHQETGVWPSNITTAAMWAAMGDPSATFYFSGRRQVDSVVSFVETPHYLTLLSGRLEAFDQEALAKLDQLAKALGDSQARVIKIIRPKRTKVH